MAGILQVMGSNPVIWFFVGMGLSIMVTTIITAETKGERQMYMNALFTIMKWVFAIISMKHNNSDVNQVAGSLTSLTFHA